MKLERKQKQSASLLLVVIFLLSISVFQTADLAADDLYATGIGGKTKPATDIDSKLTKPVKARLKKQFRSKIRRKPLADTNRVVEDAQKYKLNIAPTYPFRARSAGKEAVVVLELTFDAKGKMKDAIVRNCTTPGWGFEHASLAASLEATLKGHGNREIVVRTKLKYRLQ